MAHKFPRRMFNAPSANTPVDVDDFNEALQPFGYESGMLDETNFGGADAFGATDAERVLYMERDVGIQPYVTTAYDAAPGAPALETEEGWVRIAEQTVTCGEATLRIAAKFDVNAVNVLGDAIVGDIRINGERVFDGLSYALQYHMSGNIHALVDVAAGTHNIELIAREVLFAAGTTMAPLNKTLSVLVMEK